MPDSTQLHVAPKNQFNARSVTEFKKTATAIRKEPWHLYQAALYLENLVDPDRLGGPPTNVGALFTGFTNSGSAVQLPLPDLADVFAPGPPRPVTAFPRLACSLPFLLPLVFASMCCAPSCAA